MDGDINNNNCANNANDDDNCLTALYSRTIQISRYQKKIHPR